MTSGHRRMADLLQHRESLARVSGARPTPDVRSMDESRLYGWGCFNIVGEIYPQTTGAYQMGTWTADGWWEGPPTWLYWQVGRRNSWTQCSMLCEVDRTAIVDEYDIGLKTTRLRPVVAVTSSTMCFGFGLVNPAAELGFRIVTFQPKMVLRPLALFQTGEVRREAERLDLPTVTDSFYPRQLR